jgi:hypothetical protein
MAERERYITRCRELEGQLGWPVNPYLLKFDLEGVQHYYHTLADMAAEDQAQPVTFEDKLEAFRALVEFHQAIRHKAQGFTSFDPPAVKVKPGRKYIKVDVGTSGKYMVEPEPEMEETGHIWGIKAYGVIHRGHYYGTLDEINQWWWGDYHGIKRRDN